MCAATHLQEVTVQVVQSQAADGKGGLERQLADLSRVPGIQKELHDQAVSQVINRGLLCTFGPTQKGERENSSNVVEQNEQNKSKQTVGPSKAWTTHTHKQTNNQPNKHTHTYTYLVDSKGVVHVEANIVDGSEIDASVAEHTVMVITLVHCRELMHWDILKPLQFFPGWRVGHVFKLHLSKQKRKHSISACV